MTSQLMKHEEAVGGQAAERYLLGEMKDEERSAFEAHYLNCAECLEAVTFADEFMVQAQPVARHLRAQESAYDEPARGRNLANFFSRLMSGLKSPAPAWALVVILSGAVAYHATRQPKGAYPESRFVLTGIAHGGSEARLLVVPRNSVLGLGVEYARSGEFLSYRAQVLSESGTVKFSVVMPGDQIGSMASIALLARTLDPGRYSVVIKGKMVDGTEKEVGRGAFELQFTDK